MKPYKLYCNPDGKTLDQFFTAMKDESVVQGALMADAHLGYSLPIGGVIATKDKIFPSWVGYDIGCGMVAQKLKVQADDIMDFRDDIYAEIAKNIPVGFKTHNSPAHGLTPEGFDVSDDLNDVWKKKNASCGLATLGGGNHFIEIGRGKEDGSAWVIVHSGSRGFGHGIGTHYMKLASNSNKAKEGNYGLMVDSVDGQNYLNDMEFCLRYAYESRMVMMTTITNCISEVTEIPLGNMLGSIINKHHNYAELCDGVWIHRKGATNASEGEMGIIPGNMRDGCFIVKGKGVADSLFSSSHGAGRVLSRRAAKETLDYDEFVETMKDNDVTCRIDTGLLDESPGAYKDLFDVMNNQRDLLEVVDYVKPILNRKGS